MAWANLSYPLEEGGLEIKRLDVWNIATMGKHIWSLCQLSPTSNGQSGLKQIFLGVDPSRIPAFQQTALGHGESY